MFGIRPDERRLVIGVVSVFVLTQAGQGLGANIADTLFFLRYGVDRLPVMIVIAGLVVMGALLVYSFGGSRAGSGLLLPAVMIGCAIWEVVVWALVGSGLPIAYPILWISTQAVMWVSLTTMWNMAESTVSIQQAKRLYPVFASAGVAGGIIGNLATGPLTAALHTENVILVVAGLFLASSFAVTRVRGHFDEEVSDGLGMWSDMAQVWRLVRTSRLLRLTIPVAFSLAVLFFLVVFPFSQLVTVEFGSEVRVAGFLGLFSSLTTATTFLVSILLTRRLFSRFGVVASLLIVPLMYAVGFGLWIFSFGLVTAVVFRSAQWVTVNAIEGTAFPALFNFLSGRRRTQVLAVMRAIPTQLGIIVSGLILILGDRIPLQARFAAGVVLAIGAVVIVARMRGAYTTAIVDAVRRGLVGVFNVPGQGVISAVDGEARRVLENRLLDEREEVRALAVSALGDDPAARDRLGEMMQDPSPLVRSVVFQSLCTFDPAMVAEHAVTAIADPEPEVRVEALRSMRAADAPSATMMAERVLSDPDPGVRAVAAVTLGGQKGAAVLADLLASHDVGAIVAALDEAADVVDALDVDISEYRRHPSPRVRVSAYGIWSRNDSPDGLVSGLEDLSVGVRRAAARTLASTPQGRERLIGVLKEGSVIAAEAVLMALTPEMKSDPMFVGWAEGEASRAALLGSFRDALGEESDGRAMGLLVLTLEGRANRLQRWVLQAISDDRTEAVMAVVRRGIRSADTETRSRAIEALESVGDRALMRVLLPLLDPDPATGRMSSAAAMHALAEDFDPWLARLAILAMSERSGEGGDEMPVLEGMERRETLGLMDRVIALQRVPMFSSLDPEDLELIAGVASEAYFEPGEPIYADGDSGEEMIVIIEGEAIVTKVDPDGKRREVHRYGPFQHVGELALLRGGLRSADVGAGAEGLLGVTLNRDDLLSILEERPTVALMMLGTLADRLIEQT